MNKIVATFCIISLMMFILGCTSVPSSDPIVGSWKQEQSNVKIIMDFNVNDTGILTLDTSELYPDTPECPAVTSTDFTWKPLGNMTYEINTSDRPAPMKFIMTPSKDCIYESTQVSMLKLYRQ